MFKRFFSSLVLVATVALYGCGGGGGGGGPTLFTLGSINVTPADTSIAIGDTQQFTATGMSTTGLTMNPAPVTWSSTDTSIATINPTTGVATAVAPGLITIKATSGAIVGTTTLTVTKPLTVTTLAGLSGTPASTPGTGDGTGSTARFNNPDGITTDGTNLYVADTFNRSIRKITATGDVTTIASFGATGPIGITADTVGNLYVAEELGNTIRKIVISTEAVSIFAGSGTAGSANGIGTAAQFDSPRDITTDGTNLYVADYNNHLIRKIVIATGEVTNFASVVDPRCLTISAGNLYVTDDVLQTITGIEIATGVQTRVAGTHGTSGSVNGTGSAALFNKPLGITTDGTNLYVADSLNFSVRKIEISTGKVTTVATQSNSIQPLGITMLGTVLYTTNSDQTIKVLQ